MKKILYILSVILGLVVTSCHDDDFSITPIEEGGEVTLTFSVTVPEAQKASSRSFDNPTIKSLFLVVFEEGYRVETRKATPVNSLSVEPGEEYYFKVTLNQTPNARAIHFIANYFNADQKEENAFGTGTELALIGNLMTDIKSDDKGKVNEQPEVFWQRIDFTTGIANNDQTKALLKKVPLIRNFVQISAQIGKNEDKTPKLSDDKFVLEGFAVINSVDQGYIAPYNTQTGEFDSFGTITSGTNGIVYNPTAYEDMEYAGRIPSNANVQTTAIEDTGDGGLTFGLNPFFMFERKFDESNENHTYVLIKGRYNENQSSSYYKVALTYRDENDNPHNYNLLRNFNYVITINNVTGDGRPSAKEAAEMTGSHNDLSASIETKSYTNISDGYSRFYVSFTDTTLVSTQPIDLKFKYIPDITNNNTIVNNNVKGHDDTGNDEDDTDVPEGTVDYVTIPNLVGDVIGSYTISTADDTRIDEDGNTVPTGWRTITIIPTQLSNQKKEQSITLFAGNLSRTINFTLRPKQTMTVICDPTTVDKEVGKTVDVKIQIPDNISETLFPLVFDIEAVERTLSGSLPVWTGTSITGNGKPTFGYTKELTWEQYTTLKTNQSDIEKEDGIVTIVCPFTTNIAANASYVYVTNKYFNTGYDFFINEDNAIVDMGYYGSNKEIAVVFTATEAGEYKFVSTNAIFNNGSNSQIVTLTAGQVYETTLKTNTWSDATSVKVILKDEEEGTTIESSTARNKLVMRAISATIKNGGDVPASTMLGIYSSEAAAIAGTELLGTVIKNTLVTSSDAVLTYDELANTTNLYFAYESGNYIYVASTTAGALEAGTASLVFNQKERPLEITNAMLNPTTVSIGSGQKVTLTFHMNKKETITINAEWLTSSSVVNGKYTPIQTGNQTIEFTTTDALRGGNVVINNNDDLTLSYIRNLTINQFEVNQELSVNDDINEMTIYVVTDSGNVSIGTCYYNERTGNDRLQDISINIPNDYDGIIDNSTKIVITGQRNNRTYTIDDITLGDLINRDI